MKQSLVKSMRVVETSGHKIEGIRVGKIVNVDDSGRVLVDFPGNTQGLVSARFTNSTRLKFLRQAASMGQEVLLVFENNNSELPVIIDIIYSLVDEIAKSSTIAMQTEKLDDIVVDGKRVTFDAKEKIVLRCGKASIVLSKDGKIIIKGTHLLSRSSGMNKIKGGAVHIN